MKAVCWLIAILGPLFTFFFVCATLTVMSLGHPSSLPWYAVVVGVSGIPASLLTGLVTLIAIPCAIYTTLSDLIDDRIKASKK